MGSEKRKLHSEIDRCIKRIQEGVEEFDEIWAKVQEAVNANQKEKYETDLKKEIKKLQRLREQIKGWLNSADIKDKSALQEYRRVIEQKMEQFKVVERETKTKAYSKQGLGAEQKMDPKEKEKEDTIGWLQECIDRMSQQSDKFESEIEQLSASANKKKKLDKDKQERLDELKRHLERHKFHVLKLELLMRLLTNNSLESVQVLKIREDLEYYISNNQEQDFEENEFIYDDLNLGDIEQLAQQLGTLVAFDQDDSENNSETNTTTSVSPSASPAPSQTSKDSNKENEDVKHRHVSGGVDEIVRPIVSRATTSSFSRSTPTTPLKLTGQLSVDSALSTPPSTGTPPLPATGMSYNSVAAGTKSACVKSSILVNRTTASVNFESKPNSAATTAVTKADVVSSSPSQNSLTSLVSATIVPSPVLPPPATATLPTSTTTSTIVYHGLVDDLARSSTSSMAAMALQPPSLPPATMSTVGSTVAGVNHVASSSSLPSTTTSNVASNGPASEEAAKAEESSVMPLKLLAERVATTTPVSPSLSAASVATAASPFSAGNVLLSNNILAGSVGASFLMGFNALSSSSAQLQQPQSTQEAKIPPLLGASPLGKTLLTQEHLFQLSTMDNAMHHMPMPADSERLRTHLPRSTCQVPPHYPQSPPLMADALEYFNHLQPETLFFIFYYLEGTKAQYLAAKALKRQSWRFHTKYMMWFQRHEEPKTITEECEQGTYIYFDFEKWAQRKKEGFTFEYKYLEDKELS